MTPSQYASYVRQLQNKQNQAIRQINQEIDRVNRANKAAADKFVRDYNREVDRVNTHNKRVVENHNRRVRQENQAAKTAVARYNQSVRTHNAAVERDRQRRLSALKASTSPRYVEVRQSTFDLSDRYEEVWRTDTANTDLLALSEREAANSAQVAEALGSAEPAAPEPQGDTGVLEYLQGFSAELGDRWRGALFALSPNNPDAGRHFCTSAREIIADILERTAPDEDVIAEEPECDRVANTGQPTRRAKLTFLLRRKGAATSAMVRFVDKDIDDVIQLFRVFNEATHGPAGKHGFARLQTIRQRVEGGIMFLAAIAL